MSVALWAGIFVASPFIFYQLWKFIAPGLYKRERRISVAFAVLLGGVLRRAARCSATTSCSTRIYEFLLGYASKEHARRR